MVKYAWIVSIVLATMMQKVNAYVKIGFQARPCVVRKLAIVWQALVWGALILRQCFRLTRIIHRFSAARRVTALPNLFLMTFLLPPKSMCWMMRQICMTLLKGGLKITTDGWTHCIALGLMLAGQFPVQQK